MRDGGMGTEALSRAQRRVRWAFVAVIILLPLQFVVVFSMGNMYPCIHLPAFQPVLDNATNLYYTDRKLFAVGADGNRTEVRYTDVFNTLPEFFARHTMNHIFVGADNSDYIDLDAETKSWLYARLLKLTGKPKVVMLEVETVGYSYNKQNPINPKITLFYTLFLPFNE